MNNKITCCQSGTLLIKCTKCEYAWNTEVEARQEFINPECPNCGNNDGEYLEANLKTMGQATSSVDIPEFMYAPKKELITYEVSELKALTKLHYDLGKQQGFSNGLCIGLIILGIVLFFLFAPMTVLPV